MNLRQMYPRQTLDPLDLKAYSAAPVPVTIEKIDFKTGNSHRIGEAEITYYIKFREFAKWVKLGKTFAAQIAGTLGTEETDQWVGQVIAIAAVTIMLPDNDGSGRMKGVPLINCDIQRPRSKPTLPANSDITGLQFEVGNQARSPGPIPRSSARPATSQLPVSPNAVLGDDKAARMIIGLRSKGKTWADFEKHCSDPEIGMADLIVGRHPSEASLQLVPTFNAFKQSWPRVRDIPTPEQLEKEVEELKASWKPAVPKTPVTGEVVDPATGVVKPPQEHVEDDDIPF